jgi:hypothetical protein
VGDINDLVKYLTPLEAEVEYVPDEEEEGEEELRPLQEYEDEEGHGSGKSREEKIEMVEKMFEDVKPIAQQIIQSTKQIQTQGENNKPGDETPADLGGGVTDDGLDDMLADIDKDNEENPLQERLNNLLGLNGLTLITEAEPKVGDNVTTMDNPHGAEQGGKGAKGRKAHEQLLLNIQNQAEQIYQIMEPLKEFFPTANPLKTEESIDDAVRAFENAVKNLNIIITQINTWAGKGNIDPSLVKEFKNKLISLRDTLVKVFGVKAGDEGPTITVPNTEETAAISDAGNESGLPEDPPGDKEVTSDSAGEKEKKPFKINSTGEFVKFLTSSQGLMDSNVRRRIKKFFDPYNQVAILRFFGYLIAYKDPSVKENLNTLRTTTVKYFGIEKDAMTQIVQALKKHDPELLNAVMGLITPKSDAKKGKDRSKFDSSKGNRMYFAAFMKAAKERMEEFEIEGDWHSRMMGGQMATALSDEVMSKALDIAHKSELKDKELTPDDQKILDKALASRTKEEFLPLVAKLMASVADEGNSFEQSELRKLEMMDSKSKGGMSMVGLQNYLSQALPDDIVEKLMPKAMDLWDSLAGEEDTSDIDKKLGEISDAIEKEAEEEQRKNPDASTEEQIDNVVQDVMNDKEMQQVMKDQGIEQAAVEKEVEDIFKDELSDKESEVLQKFLGFVKELKNLNEVGPSARDANKRSILQALGITDKIFKQAVGKLDREEQEMFKILVRKKGKAVLNVINPDAAGKEQPEKDEGDIPKEGDVYASDGVDMDSWIDASATYDADGDTHWEKTWNPGAVIHDVWKPSEKEGIFVAIWPNAEYVSKSEELTMPLSKFQSFGWVYSEKLTDEYDNASFEEGDGWFEDFDFEEVVSQAKEEKGEDAPQEEIITRAEEIAMEDPEVQKAAEEEPKAEKAVEKAIEKIASGEEGEDGPDISGFSSEHKAVAEVFMKMRPYWVGGIGGDDNDDEDEAILDETIEEDIPKLNLDDDYSFTNFIDGSLGPRLDQLMIELSTRFKDNKYQLTGSAKELWNFIYNELNPLIKRSLRGLEISKIEFGTKFDPNDHEATGSENIGADWEEKIIGFRTAGLERGGTLMRLPRVFVGL